MDVYCIIVVVVICNFWIEIIFELLIVLFFFCIRYGFKKGYEKVGIKKYLKICEMEIKYMY